MSQDENLWCQTDCGFTWEMDFEPSPDCDCEFWRIGVEYPDGTFIWGAWVDAEGNPR